MEITQEQWQAYVRVQESGLTNMFDVNKVIALSNGILNRDACMAIMTNYGTLKQQFGED